MTKTIAQRVGSALGPLRFLSFTQLPRFLAYRRGRGGRESAFRIKRVPHPMICRARTTDAITLESVFAAKHHLPPAPLKADAVILDLGANAGYAAAHFASLYPSALILAVELDAGNAALALRNLAPFQNVEVIQAGVWIEDGEIAYGGEEADAFAIGESGKQTAPGLRIETILDRRGIIMADYVKMDIEGAEWPMFQDAAWLDRIGSISVEIHRREWFEPIRKTLEAHGFQTASSTSHWSSISGIRQ
jgi:FkbM family methyltransferase